MNYNEMDDNRSRIFIGNLTVYLILAVSFAATIAYWVVLAGLENSRDLPSGWYLLLWLIVGVGAVAEVIKKVTLSTYRNTLIWLLATAVSVLTVMGTYAILNSTRQDQITKSSDAYQDGRALKQKGLDDAAKYAHAAGYNLDELDTQLKRVICLRGSGHGAGAECGGGKSISYSSYLNQKKAIQAKIADAKAYQRAMSTADMGKQTMAAGGSTGTSSNPLLSDISSAIGVSEKSIINTFYLAVTLLLEFAAFFIGGQVEELKRAQRYSERELQELKNKALFGVTIAELMGYEAPTLAEQRAQSTPQQPESRPEIDAQATQPSSTRPHLNDGEITPTTGVPVTAKASTEAEPKTLIEAPVKAEKAPQSDAKEKTDIQPTEKQEAATKTSPKPAKQTSRIDGFGFGGTLVEPKNNLKAYPAKGVSDVTAKRSDNHQPQPKHTALQHGKTTKHTAPEHAKHTEVNPRVLCARTQKHTEHTANQNTQNTQNTESLYNDWERALSDGAFRPVARESRSFIQKRLSANQQAKESMTIKQCGEISKAFMLKAVLKGVLISNPKKAANQPKYLLSKEST